ncbi:MAG: hypothetical protein ACE5JH_00285 [Acidobacteriota bacterium]
MKCPSVTVALGAALCLASPPALSQSPIRFSSYSSYSAKFDLASKKFSLITSVVVYNISGQTFSDVRFKQTYPEGVTVKETYQRDVGTEATGEQRSERRVEDNVFYASLDKFRNRQYVVIFNELELARRLDEITFPGIEISYLDGQGERRIEQLADNTYDLFIYSNVVGGLTRFLKKYNRITFDFTKAVPDRTEWEFAPIVASARGRFPTGIIGTFPGEDRYNGYFRIRSGPPGDNVQILVVYRDEDGKTKISDSERLLSEVRDYLKWCGEFETVEEGLKVSRGKWKKYKDAWSIEGRWRDTIKDRLGEGVLKAKVFHGPREDVEYIVLALAHGRGLGPESSATPNPGKEAELSAELDALLETFRSYIVRLSHER